MENIFLLKERISIGGLIKLTVEDNLRTAYHILLSIVKENPKSDIGENSRINKLEKARLLVKEVLIDCENGRFF